MAALRIAFRRALNVRSSIADAAPPPACSRTDFS